jgi:alpha-glutamyl/putrescinyl thymine pyrophosphorylase clade 1
MGNWKTASPTMHDVNDANFTEVPVEDEKFCEGSFEIAGAAWRTTLVFDSYWRFAQARQELYHHRVRGWALLPCTDDILSTYKFTNAYRAADRVSQYLIREVIYSRDRSAENLFFRILLFKIFNKIDTWELLTATLGDLYWSADIIPAISEVLNDALHNGNPIYSAAYIMPSGGGKYPRKHDAHLELLRKMMEQHLHDQIHDSRSMEQAFTLLRAQPMLGDFLAYQFVTDLNYSELCNFSEQEFVIPGPGARDGIRKCFPDLPMSLAPEAIKAVCLAQKREFAKRDICFRDLWGRPLQLIDCQNLFCEVDKYARIAHPGIEGMSGRTRIKQQYRPKGPMPQPFFPPKWKLHLTGLAESNQTHASITRAS